MKKLLSLIFLFVFFGFMSCKTDIKTTVNVYVKGDGKTAVIYAPPIQGTNFIGFRDTAMVIENSKPLVLTFEIDEPAFFTVWIESKPEDEYKLLLEHGGEYSIFFDTANDDVLITGDNEKGQMLYNTLPNPPFIQMEAYAYRLDTLIETIQQKIAAKKGEEIIKFDSLLLELEINNEFFESIVNDRDCYYASLEAITLFLKNRNNDPQLNREISTIFVNYNPDVKLMQSPFWYEYALLYLQYQRQNDEDFKYLNEEFSHTGFIELAKKYLPANVLEFWQARYLYTQAIQLGYEKELLTLFDRFKEDYPHSAYTPYLEKDMQVIVDFHNKIAEPFSETIRFIPDYQSIATLEEAVKPFKGKKVYIDIWATWCGPCKSEFEHNQFLKNYLAENDIQMLYISIDVDQRDAQWKDMIKYYDLQGYHIRANKDLDAYLRKIHDKKEGQSIKIPWYMVIDEQGNIMKERAKSPSQLKNGESLF